MKSAEDLKVMQDSITQLQANMADNENKVQELSAQIQELQEKRDQVMECYSIQYNFIHPFWEL